MTTASVSPPTAAAERIRPSRMWPLWGLAAGILGAVATIFTTQQLIGGPQDVDTLPRGAYHLGGALGYLTVACLLALSACWRAAIQRVAPDQAAGRLVADGLTASAAGLTLGYGWKLAMALYLPGGLNGQDLGAEGLFTYYVLNDFGGYLGWLGVVISAGAMAWLGFRAKLISTWLAVLSVLPPLAVLAMACGISIAGYPGIVAPVWLTLTCVGLLLGKHRIVGTR